LRTIEWRAAYKHDEQQQNSFTVTHTAGLSGWPRPAQATGVAP